jgi:hypothetical protein
MNRDDRDLEQNLLLEKLNSLTSSVQKIIDKTHNIDKTLVKQEKQLEVHIYRTELAENRLDHIEKSIDPIKKHVNRVDGALKLLGLLMLIISIVGGALGIYKAF